MKSNLNILEAYLDKVLLEGGGVHQKWFSGADETSIAALKAVAMSNNSQLTRQGAEAEAGKAGAWGGAQISAPEFDAATGQVKKPGTVYWMSNTQGVINSGSADKVLAAIADWKPKDAPSEKDVMDVEQGVADGTLKSAEEQQADFEEESRQQEAEFNDRKTNQEQLDRMTANLDQLGYEFGLDKTSKDGDVRVDLSAEELANALDAACKVPPKNSNMGAILEYTRGPENKYGWEGDVNQELLDGYDEILQLAPHIQEDGDDRYVLEENITEKQRDILDATRCRRDGLFLGWNRNNETRKAFPKLDMALAGVAQAKVDAGKNVAADFAKYGVSNKVSKNICEAFAGVTLRSKDGTDSPLLKPSATGKKGENNLVGVFTESCHVGIIEFMNGRGDEGGNISKGVTEFAEMMKKLDKSVRANEALWEGIVPSMTTEEEQGHCEWYQEMERIYDIYASPNELTKALFMQRASELKTIIEVGGVAPVRAWAPTKEEERGTDKQLGVKRDVVWQFASDADAQKFAENIGLTKDYAHGNEVDLSLKTLESLNKPVNFEGCTLDVSMGNAANKSKRDEYEANFENRVNYIKRTNKAMGEKYAANMTSARDWDRKQYDKIQKALSTNNSDILPALTNIIESVAGKNTSVAGNLQNQRDLQKFKDMVADLGTADPAERQVLGTYITRNLLSLVKSKRAETNKNYAQGAALHDVINTLTSKESEGVLRISNGEVRSFQGDMIMDDAIAAVDEGRFKIKDLGGFDFHDEKGNKMFGTSCPVAKQSSCFSRIRGTVNAAYMNSKSKTLGES